MRGLWNFVLLGFIFQVGSELGLSRHLVEDENSFDANKKLKEFVDFEESREEDRDKRLNGAATASEEIPKSGELFEGDIIMDESLRAAVLGNADKRSVLMGEGKLWPNATVPIKFDKEIGKWSKKCILHAIRTFTKHTCIKFKWRDNEEDYVYFSSKRNVCSSYVGRRGGKQTISIGRGCTRLGTCQHEIMHALGTIHEQSRPDRDSHVKIVWDNIKSNEQSNFRKYSYNTVSDEGVEYDFMSVMHYPNHAFAKDRAYPTIISRMDPKLRFGQRIMFSRGDVEAINRLYNCGKDHDIRELPEVLSDEEVKERRDLREEFDQFK